MNEPIKLVFLAFYEQKKADEFVSVNPKTRKPYTDFKRSFATAGKKTAVAIWNGAIWGVLALAGYDAFTIKALMRHREMNTTERYIPFRYSCGGRFVSNRHRRRNN